MAIAISVPYYFYNDYSQFVLSFNPFVSEGVAGPEKIYVINLDRSIERMAYFKKQIEQAKLNYTIE